MQLLQIVGSRYFIIPGSIFEQFLSLVSLVYNPSHIIFSFRASPSEFIIPLAKYVKAVYHTRVSVGMRFRMLFETEESSVRRYAFFKISCC